MGEGEVEPPTASQSSEERRRTGQYVALGVVLLASLIGLYQACAQSNPVLVGLLAPGLIMICYLLWLLYSSRKKTKLEQAAALLPIIMKDGIVLKVDDDVQLSGVNVQPCEGNRKLNGTSAILPLPEGSSTLPRMCAPAHKRSTQNISTAGVHHKRNNISVSHMNLKLLDAPETKCMKRSCPDVYRVRDCLSKSHSRANFLETASSNMKRGKCSSFLAVDGLAHSSDKSSQLLNPLYKTSTRSSSDLSSSPTIPVKMKKHRSSSSLNELTDKTKTPISIHKRRLKEKCDVCNVRKTNKIKFQAKEGGDFRKARTHNVS